MAYVSHILNTSTNLFEGAMMCFVCFKLEAAGGHNGFR